MKKLLIPIALLLLFTFLICFCSTENNKADSAFLNTRDSVAYVGMQTCRSCHKDKYDSFIHTGMGHSFGEATQTRTDAFFGDHALVYDSFSNMYYKPFIKDSLMYVKEYRLQGKDTIHSRTERINYIIGSGHHTNSHITNINGYLYQIPITFYTQDKKWDLAPGFEKGKNSRFSRLLSSECITCHNHYPDYIKGSENRYAKVPLGIECERCHGPGALHVKKMLAGETVDTAKQTDYTIVNPKRLPRELIMDICQRCHLQGVTVLNEGKSFFDFKPGKQLSSEMNVFLPRYSDSEKHFIMASQADRLRLSTCYLNSKMSCITCHNPHVSSRTLSNEYFNNTCIKCHKQPDGKCSVNKSDFAKEKGNCIKCHMPRSGSIDIPHVTITDHNIRKSTSLYYADKTSKSDQKQKFLGLQILTKEKATPLEMAKAYLALYDKFIPDKMILDSAEWYLNKSKESDVNKFSTLIHLYFTREDYNKIAQIAGSNELNLAVDGWTAYHIGEAHYQLGNLALAKSYYDKAVSFMPLHLDFLEKQAVVYAELKQLDKAKDLYEKILKLNPKREVALNNLGLIYAQKSDYAKANKYYDNAIALDPDYTLALLNKAGLNMAEGNKKQAKLILQRVLKIDPSNEQARLAIKSL